MAAKPADAVEIRFAKRQRRAETKIRHAEQTRYERTGGELGRDGKRFETARPVVRFGAIEARDQRDAWIRERRGDIPQIVRGNADVAVVDEQKRMPRMAR